MEDKENDTLKWSKKGAHLYYSQTIMSKWLFSFMVQKLEIFEKHIWSYNNLVKVYLSLRVWVHVCIDR